jgi:pSer/pThr/pTyr-binding forkhead associated (FHA) protein
MRDGLTKKMTVKTEPTDALGVDTFLTAHRAALVAIAGDPQGTEFPLEQECVTLGRGPNVDLAFKDEAMSRQHAAIEFVDGRFRVRDLGSTNGLQVNGSLVQVAALQHGDHVQIGTLEFQLIIEERDQEPETYELPPV